jgi:hypothetical protein
MATLLRQAGACACVCVAVLAFILTPVLGVDGEVVTSRAEGLTIAVGLLILASILAGRR